MAEDPLIENEWMEYESAWQALAAILEYSEACKSGDPSNYISYLHVHMDGSCNGL